MSKYQIKFKNYCALSQGEDLCSTHVIRVINGKIYRNGKIEKGDLWISNGKVLDAQKIFYGRSNCDMIEPDEVIDAEGMIVAPGFIDIQINGAYGVDFSDPLISKEDIKEVRKRLYSTGCTAICPTIITTDPDTYKTLLPLYTPEKASLENGCAILGVHAEGPFLSPSRAGAHPKECIQSPVHGEQSLLECYGSTDTISLITLAPELEGSLDTIRHLKNEGITVSIGHTAAHIAEAVQGVKAGASLITHLFNAMTPFHHRDPGVIGLLGMPVESAPFYSIIVDGIHSHEYSVRLAHKALPTKCVLITDAMAAMGLEDGHHRLGKQRVIVGNNKAVLEDDPETLAGAIVSIDECIRSFKQFTNCSAAEAIRNATQNPAKVLNIADMKGDLQENMDADFVLLDENLNVHATYVGGTCVWKREL